MNIENKKIKSVVILQLIIATGFVVGAKWTNPTIYIIYQSYFADIFLPFGFYFLLHLLNNKFFDSWWKKALVVFILVSTSETLQYFGIYAIAQFFDPLDYLMYAVGVLLAVLVDRKIYTKIFSFWT